MLHRMMLWGGRNTFKRHAVKITMNVTSSNMNVMSSTLSNMLSKDVQKKVIIHTNTAEQASRIAEEVNLANDVKSLFKGDTMLIIGDQHPEVKHHSAQKFTMEMTSDEVQSALKSNQFHPRVLVATSSCIGAGLDCAFVCGVVRIGFPTSILNLAQEMGRCGRNRSNNGSSPTDHFILILTLNDCVYLHERLFTNVDETAMNHPSRIISYEMQRNKQLDDLLSVLQLLFLNQSCWHRSLETIVGHLLESEGDPSDACVAACPACCGNVVNQLIMPARRDGVKSFLNHAFMRNDRNDELPEHVVKKLK